LCNYLFFVYYVVVLFCHLLRNSLQVTYKADTGRIVFFAFIEHNAPRLERWVSLSLVRAIRCIFLRSQHRYGRKEIPIVCGYHCTFLFGGSSENVLVKTSKCKVAPLKPMTVPRLELAGAVLGLRLTQHLTLVLRLPMQSVTFYSNSMDVL